MSESEEPVIVVRDAPRYVPAQVPSGDRTVREAAYTCSLGDLDIFFLENELRVVCSIEDAQRRGRAFNYTLFWLEDGALKLPDNDVHVDLYHQCLLLTHYDEIKEIAWVERARHMWGRRDD